MSGHSKWSSIKHKKSAVDAKRGRLFTKLIREITVAARIGGGDPESNPRLRTAVLKAKEANMPKENIDRAIKKGTGELEGEQFYEMTYEAYGPGGVAILINTLTDNKNRTTADLRNILSRSNGSLGESGCVAYLFKRKGLITFSAEKYSEEDIFSAALEAGAEDVITENKTIEVTTAPDEFESVFGSLKRAGFKETFAEITMIPEATIKLDEESTKKAMKLIDQLDDHEDVQSIATNLDIPDDFKLEDE
ncbi:MAG: YebC/PmpR family DNA-binding transcriptional regulator [Spirochaetes bacterium]|nr:MAG: YebC/PmpR family DNA-binding transcriptional regulator [Spirochaetota bacterium]